MLLLVRNLALASASELAPVIVLTKVDAATPLSIERAFDGMRGRIAASLPLVMVDARSPDAALLLEPYLGAGQTAVVLGSSGAGKSTLTNTLIGAAVQDTGAVREHDSRGKHTTKHGDEGKKVKPIHLFVTHLENGQECFLWDFHITHLLHPLLTGLLFFQ